MKNKLSFSTVRFFILILIAIYQLFSLSSIDFEAVNPASPASLITLTLTILIGLFWILLIYLVPLLFVIVYTMEIRLPNPVITMKRKVIYIISLFIGLKFTRKRKYDVIRC